MKGLINGTWYGDLDSDPDLHARYTSMEKDSFRGWITEDGAAGFKAEAGRYHLYVSYACPWTSRTILYHRLKGLEDTVTMSVAHPVWGSADGWRFADTELSTRDHLAGRSALQDIYVAAKRDFTGRATVPVLWDKKTGAIVSNESIDIIRMLDRAFDAWGDTSVRFRPPARADTIDAMNAVVLGDVCMGVYKAGFATSQVAYDDAVRRLFATLDDLEDLLSGQPYLIGSEVTESDWHLFMTLVRFDAVYHGKLKCSARRLIDYPNLNLYARRLYELPGVAATVRLDHAKLHYFDDLGMGNSQIIPVDPTVDFRRAA